jgi:hypothetical protein
MRKRIATPPLVVRETERERERESDGARSVVVDFTTYRSWTTRIHQPSSLTSDASSPPPTSASTSPSCSGRSRGTPPSPTGKRAPAARLSRNCAPPLSWQTSSGCLVNGQASSARSSGSIMGAEGLLLLLFSVAVWSPLWGDADVDDDANARLPCDVVAAAAAAAVDGDAAAAAAAADSRRLAPPLTALLPSTTTTGRARPDQQETAASVAGAPLVAAAVVVLGVQRAISARAAWMALLRGCICFVACGGFGRREWWSGRR